MTAELTPAPTSTGGRHRGIRVQSAIVVLLLLVITLGGAQATRNAVRDQEQRLLSERAGEVGLILQEAFSTFAATITTAAGDTRLGGGDVAAFQRAAEAAGPLAGGGSLALAEAGSGPTTFLHVDGAPLPDTATGARDAAIRKALTAKAAVSTGVFTDGGSRRFGVASAVGAGDLVVYRESVLTRTPSQSATAQQQPFQELRVVLYASPTPDPSQQVFTTTANAHLTGRTASKTIPIGASSWLVVAEATTPLVGTFAFDADWLVLILGLVLTGAVGFLTESVLRRRDYTMALVADRTAALRESLGQLEDAQAQIVRQERLAAIGELASAVGHELRNPLGVITNALYLLRTALGTDLDERTMRQLSTAEREVGAASLIVGDLLDFSRAREPVPASVDVVALIEEVLNVVPPPPRVDVRTDAGAESVSALVDRDQMRQVLLNLVSNGYDAMPEGGTVTIVLRAAGGHVHIQVRDTGSGMDAETKARVFEPFFTRKAKGIGLGLAVTKRIVEAHAGSITVDSTPGEGSTFDIDLPAGSPEPAP